MNAIRAARFSWNIIKSVGYDFWYAVFARLKLRAGAEGYASYRAAKLYPDYLKFGAAVEAVKPLAAKYCQGRGVDIGASDWPLPGARAIEDNEEENAYRINEADASLDFVFSSHTLEHLDKPWDALTEWGRVLRDDGILFLYLPHPACLMWKAEHLKFHLWNPDPASLEQHLAADNDYEILYITYLPDAFFSFVVVARKIARQDEKQALTS